MRQLADEGSGKIDWREQLITRLLEKQTRQIGSPNWRWSIDHRSDYADGHPENALCHVTINVREVVAKSVRRAETFCRDVLSVGNLTPAEHQQIIEYVAERHLREYLERVARWLMNAEHLLSEVAVSIAGTEGGALRTLDRQISPGDPSPWLYPRVLRRQLTRMHSDFLKREIASLRSPVGRRSQTDNDLLLFLTVVKLRKQLQDAGEKHADRKASQKAREQFKIVTYENYKKRMNKGRKTARMLGLI